MELTVAILLSFLAGWYTKDVPPCKVPEPKVIEKCTLPQVPYPDITNNQYDNCLDNAKQCATNYFKMKEAFIECSNNAKIGQ